MNCFDCALAGAVTPALAVCHDCGAAVCADHAVARDHYLTRTATINRDVAVEPPRRLSTDAEEPNGPRQALEARPQLWNGELADGGLTVSDVDDGAAPPSVQATGRFCDDRAEIRRAAALDP